MRRSVFELSKLILISNVAVSLIVVVIYGWHTAVTQILTSVGTSILVLVLVWKNFSYVVSEQKFRQLADAMPQIVWTASPDGELDYYNQKWYEFSGVNPNDRDPSKGWSALMYPEEEAAVTENFYSCIKKGCPYQQELRLKDRTTGQFRWFLARALPARDSAGKITKWYGTCTDIHDQKEAQRSRDDFLSIASHELKTPVSSLKLQLQLARMGVDENSGMVPPAAQLAKTLDLSNRQVDRLVHLIENLLDVSRITSGKIKYDFEKLNLSDLLNETLENFAGQFKASKIEVSKNIESKITGTWDKSRLAQVFENLFSNAVKYALGKPLSVTAYVKESNAIISVKDQGPGIPPEKHSAIFERFERAISARNISGLGLGLYISKEIITAMGGQIKVESSVQKGAEFIIQLPLQPIVRNS